MQSRQPLATGGDPYIEEYHSDDDAKSAMSVVTRVAYQQGAAFAQALTATLSQSKPVQAEVNPLWQGPPTYQAPAKTWHEEPEQLDDHQIEQLELARARKNLAQTSISRPGGRPQPSSRSQCRAASRWPQEGTPTSKSTTVTTMPGAPCPRLL